MSDRQFTDKSRKPEKIACKVCYDLTHRRLEQGCKGCGQAYQAEKIEQQSVSLGSSLGDGFKFPEGGPE